MPEGTETTETTAPETAAPEETPEQAAPETGHQTGVQEPAPEATEPEGGPDLSDALGQVREFMGNIDRRLDRAGVPGAEDEEPLAGLLGQQDADYYDDQGEPDPQGQQQLTAEEQDQQQVQQLLDEAVRQRVEPYLVEQEMNRRTDQIQAFAQSNPQLTQPEVMNRVEAELAVLDPNFGQQGYAPDPRVLAIAYRSVQAELAMQGQTSTGPAGSEQGTAEAVGQGGATLETGAGPSAPPADVDPQEAAWTGALSSGAKPNQYGF